MITKKHNWLYHQLKFYFQDIGIEAKLIESLLKLFKVKEMNKDDFFAKEGEKTDKLGFVCKGCFYMFITNIRGDLDVKEFIGSNSFILSIFNTNLSLASIQALTESVVLEASYSAVKKLYATDPKLDALAQKSMENRFNEICVQMHNLKNKTAKERYELFKEKYQQIEKYIPQYLVASFLGITPTQLSRIRKNNGSSE